MSETEQFEDDDFEKEEEALFAGENGTETPESKGMRLDPSLMAIQFRKWLKVRHPEIGGAHNLSRNNIMYYVHEFERDTGIQNTFRANDWIVTLQRY